MAGEVEVYGPFRADNKAAIIAGLGGNSVVVADDITAHVLDGNVYYTVIKA